MKKLLAVLLVLGLASVASAADVSIDGTKATILNVGDTLVINVDSTVGLLGLDAILASADAGIVEITSATGFGWDPGLSFAPAITPGAGEIGYGNFGGVAPGTVASFTVTGVAKGETVVTLGPGQAFGGSMTTDFTTPEIGGEKVIEVVPEPMTMSLLGLGGLALIRRRRA